tara:strand:- start:2168 stop:2818 length:651 start_codon:yes stop_codon:yes gene_type:complete
MRFGVPQFNDDIKGWAVNLTRYLVQSASKLVFKVTGASAAENGVILWDDANGYPVVSKGGEWRQIVLEDGQFMGSITTNQTAAVVNTAYPLTYTSSYASGITNGTPASRLVFEEAGQYMISFSAQIASASSSTVSFWFWPRVNGTDIAGSTMISALHTNNATLVVGRSSIFEISAGDYLEFMWAVDNTSGSLSAVAATAFAPAAPASAISITRIHG